jgi:hypothetical protein
MSEHQYAIGDRVKYIGTETDSWKDLVGTIVEILEKDRDYDMRVVVMFDKKVGVRFMGATPQPYVRNLMFIGDSEFMVDL